MPRYRVQVEVAPTAQLRSLPLRSRQALPCYRVQVAPTAQLQNDEVAAWWRANRPAASALVADELEAAVDRLTGAPHGGVLYGPGDLRAIRRLLLPRIR